MKFTGFKVVPSIRVRFYEEGEFHYEIADDQDPTALEIARLAEVEADCELPEAIELRWAPGSAHMAFRSANHPEGDESPVSGDFSGFGAVLEATYVNDDEGVTHAVTFSEGSSDYMEQLCAALNALLEPVRIVADISGGILNGTWSDRPARVLYTSDDSDDALDFDDYYLAPMSENIYRRRHAWWLHDAELDGDTIDHFHNQVKEG